MARKHIGEQKITKNQRNESEDERKEEIEANDPKNGLIFLQPGAFVAVAKPSLKSFKWNGVVPFKRNLFN